MDFKKIVLSVVLFCWTSSGIWAQDDMYFTPKKSDKIKVEEESMPVSRYNYQVRDVDEYNRRGDYSGFGHDIDLDTLYSDVVFFDTDSILSDTIIVAESDDYAYTPEDDYTYSRQLSRYDDFYWYDPWLYGWYGYGPYWYGRPYWYAGWWYDPWYYGWYRPWGWYYPTYWYGYYRPYRGVTGTLNHGNLRGHAGNSHGYRGNDRRSSNSSFRGNRYGNSDRPSTNNNRFRGNRPNNFNRQNSTSRPSYNNSFGSNRSGGSFRGGGSFGGSRGGSGGGGFRGRR